MNEKARPARESDDPEHQKPISVCWSPSSEYSAWKHGISISTPLVVPSVRRTCGAWANPTTATSRKVTLFPLQVVFVGVVVGVGFAGRLEEFDVVDAQAQFLAGLPHGLDPHAHPHLGRVDLLNQVQERDIGAVEQYVGRDVRGLDPLPGERDV